MLVGVLRGFCQIWTLHMKWYVGGNFEEALSEVDFAYIEVTMLVGVLREFCQNWTLHMKWYVSGNFDEALSKLDFV